MKKVFACLCALLLFLLGSSCALRSPHAFAEEQKEIYLTFDDGPSDRITPKILNTLNLKGVRATFFIVGKNAALRKNLTRRIFDEGNSIGIHSYSHEYKKIYSSAESLLEDIKKCSDLLEQTGIKTRLYRFPGGKTLASEKMLFAVRNAGYVCVDWNAVCGDSEFSSPTPDMLLTRAIESSAGKKKVVMLFHDSTDKSATAAALPDIIDYFKEMDYKFLAFSMT